MRVDERIIRYAIALLFVLAGLWAMLVRGNAWPFAMADLGLAPHQALINEARLEHALEQETLNGDIIVTLAREIVAREPLSVYAFEGLLSVEVDMERLVPGSMDGAAADIYARASLDRDGRNLTARFYLLDKAILSGDWDEALRQFGRAYDLWPEQRQELLFGLDQMLAEPGMVETVIRASNKGADWVPVFLRQISIEAIAPDQLEQLFRPQPEAHERLLGRLVQLGRFEQAYEFWRGLEPDETVRYQYALVDPSFEGSSLLAPFNWQFGDGIAELLPSQDALQVFYRGRGRVVFASQITRLTPGTYVFLMNLDAMPNEGSGDFVWQIECLTSEDTPLEISIFDEPKMSVESGIPFEISEACQFQELSLRGYPGQFTRSVTLQVNDIAIASMEAVR